MGMLAFAKQRERERERERGESLVESPNPMAGYLKTSKPILWRVSTL